MRTLIVKSLINSHNTHHYSQELIYTSETQSNNLFEIYFLHYTHIIAATQSLDSNTIANDNVIVCCANHADFSRPILEPEHIYPNIIYTNKNYLTDTDVVSDFRNFYGHLSTVLKFLAVFKMLHYSSNQEQMLPEHIKHIVTNYNHGIDYSAVNYALKKPHLLMSNNILFNGNLTPEHNNHA